VNTTALLGDIAFLAEPPPYFGERNRTIVLLEMCTLLFEFTLAFGKR
jgi:hypothetical protein